MSANQRKVAILKNLLERVQQRAAAPRTAAKVAAVALAASATAEAAVHADDEPTPLVPSSALSSQPSDSLQLAEELTPSEEIVVVELSPSPSPVEVDELEVVEDDLASEAARIEEALSSDADDDPSSSSERPQVHPLEAAMAPMELDAISDRPTARITLPPEADPAAVLDELPKPNVPVIEEDVEPSVPQPSVPQPSAPAPEITISSDAAEVALIPDEDELIELDEPLDEEVEEAPPASQVQPPTFPPAEPEAAPAAAPELPRDITTLQFDEPAEPVAEPALELEEVIELEVEESAPAPAVEEAPAPVAEALRAEEPAEAALAEPVALEDELEGLEDEPVAAQAAPVTTEEERVPAQVELVAIEAVQVPTLAEPVVAEEKPEPTPEEPRRLEAELVQRPAAAEAEVAAVVGKVESFAPTTFGELLDASLEL